MNAPVLRIRADGTPELPSYEAARAALKLCASIDEAKHILDRAAALAAYAMQRDDNALLVSVQEIRLRASIRVGELVQELECGRAGRPAGEISLTRETDSRDAAIGAAGLSRATAYRLQELAGPRDENLKVAGSAAAEIYFARCRESMDPATDKGLRAAIVAGVQAAMTDTEIRRRHKALLRDDLAAKAERRAEREVLLGERSVRASARLGTTLYPVLYADPPWDHEAWSADTGKGRAAANHYPTMSLDDICALPVPAAPSAVLFLWVPANLVPEGCRVVEAWGFAYSTHCIWRKPHAITGYWFRSVHELLFVAKRGYDVPAPAIGTQPESVIEAALARRQHSLKPDHFADLIAGLYPTSPKVELFARRSRPGWDVWGNEVEPDDDPADGTVGATPDDGGAARPVAGTAARADGGPA